MKKTLREIDAMVAEHVMGWTHIGDAWTYPDETGREVSTICYGNPPLSKPSPGWDRLEKCGVPAGQSPTPPEAEADSEEPAIVNGAWVCSLSVVPRYSKGIDATWDVLGMIEGRDVRIDYSRHLGCRVTLIDTAMEELDAVAVARDAPLAICLAALNAHGIDVEPETP